MKTKKIMNVTAMFIMEKSIKDSKREVCKPESSRLALCINYRYTLPLFSPICFCRDARKLISVEFKNPHVRDAEIAQMNRPQCRAVSMKEDSFFEM